MGVHKLFEQASLSVQFCAPMTKFSPILKVFSLRSTEKFSYKDGATVTAGLSESEKY